MPERFFNVRLTNCVNLPPQQFNITLEPRTSAYGSKAPRNNTVSYRAQPPPTGAVQLTAPPVPTSFVFVLPLAGSVRNPRGKTEPSTAPVLARPQPSAGKRERCSHDAGADVNHVGEIGGGGRRQQQQGQGGGPHALLPGVPGDLLRHVLPRGSAGNHGRLWRSGAPILLEERVCVCVALLLFGTLFVPRAGSKIYWLDWVGLGLAGFEGCFAFFR